MSEFVASLMPDIYGLLFIGLVYLVVIRLMPRLQPEQEVVEVREEAPPAGH